jgi:DNA-nicking Smr family endonuclease
MTKRPPRLDADPDWMRPTRMRGPEGGDLFHRAMAGVRPLKRRSRPAPAQAAGETGAPEPAGPPKPRGRTGAPATRPATRVDPAALFRGDGDARPAARAAGDAPVSDKGLAEKLRRGRLRIDRRIDLHGLTQSRAHAVVLRALAEAHEAGERTILIITGTGLRKKLMTRDPGAAQPGILRAALPHWLAVPPLSGLVLAVSRARIEHGGEGAFYVMLRRARR